MNAIAVVVPGSIATRTGGYEYDRRMIAALRARGWTVAVFELDGSFPNPDDGARARAARVLAAIPDGATVVCDGLAYSAMPVQIEAEAARLRFVPIVHMPLALDTGLSSEEARELEGRERRALAAARAVLVTGKSSVATLAGYGIARDRIVVVEPGTAPAPVAVGSHDPSAVHLLCVAAVSPGKGHEVLIKALASIPERGWRLTCAGSLDRHPETVQRLRDLLASLRLDDRVSLAGEVDDRALAALYDSADLFALATLHETYGMAVAEALARGIPVVSCDTGAIGDLVGDEAGIVVAPGDQQALAHALASALDARVRGRLSQGARRVRERLKTWDDAASMLSDVLQRVGR